MIIKLFNQKKLSLAISSLIFICLFNIQKANAQHTIDSLSFQNLKLELYSSFKKISTATGFIIEKNGKNYLITNLHVFTGVDYFSKAIIDSNQQIPFGIAIWHNAQKLGYWQQVWENLYSENKAKRWIECEINGKVIDLAALPLEYLPKEIKTYPVNFKSFNDSMLVLPGFSASIIGFSYGLSPDGKIAIWKTGHIASDFDVDANGLPMFMIDATTRPGMSGAMVVLRMMPFFTKKTINMGLGTKFLGIYTAQSSQEELGYVIKPIALKALIDKLP